MEKQLQTEAQILADMETELNTKLDNEMHLNFDKALHDSIQLEKQAEAFAQQPLPEGDIAEDSAPIENNTEVE